MLPWLNSTNPIVSQGDYELLLRFDTAAGGRKLQVIR